MKWLWFSCFLLPLAWPESDESALDPSELVKRHQRAIGGLDQFQQFETMKSTFEIQTAGGFRGRETVYFFQPNSYRREVEYPDPTPNKVEIYFGGNAWANNPMNNHGEKLEMLPLSRAKLLLNELQLAGPLATLKPQHKYALKLQGQDPSAVSGFLLQLHSIAGRETFLIDASSYLLREHTTHSGKQAIRYVYSDYRDIAGMKVPYKIDIQSIDGQLLVSRQRVDLDLDLQLSKSLITEPLPASIHGLKLAKHEAVSPKGFEFLCIQQQLCHQLPGRQT